MVIVLTLMKPKVPKDKFLMVLSRPRYDFIPKIEQGHGVLLIW